MQKPNKYLIDGENGKHITHLEHNTLINARMFCRAVKETTDKCIIVIDAEKKRRAITIEDIKNILTNYSFMPEQFYILCYHKGVFAIKEAVQGLNIKEV